MKSTNTQMTDQCRIVSFDIACSYQDDPHMTGDNKRTGPEPGSKLHVSRSAERVLSLLDTVISRGAVALTAASTEAGIPISTALRHLRVLTHHGYLVRDDVGRYSAGPAFLRMALATFRSGPYARLTAAAQPELKRLADVTEESAYLAVRDGAEAIYIATVESRRAIRHVGWVGRSVPIDGTAVGEALGSEPRPPGIRPSPLFNTGAIEPDVTAVVAPIYGSSGVLGAFSVLGPAERVVGDRLTLAARAVVDSAVSVSLALASV